MGLGGPVWHASAGIAPRFDEAFLRAEALKALEGVGCAELGEWHEWTGKTYHVQRRLTAKEQEQVGPVLDIRGTKEAYWRLKPLRNILPPNWPEYFEQPKHV